MNDLQCLKLNIHFFYETFLKAAQRGQEKIVDCSRIGCSILEKRLFEFLCKLLVSKKRLVSRLHQVLQLVFRWSLNIIEKLKQTVYIRLHYVHLLFLLPILHWDADVCFLLKFGSETDSFFFVPGAHSF